jgi:hypothetical protein
MEAKCVKEAEERHQRDRYGLNVNDSLAAAEADRKWTEEEEAAHEEQLRLEELRVAVAEHVRVAKEAAEEGSSRKPQKPLRMRPK